MALTVPFLQLGPVALCLISDLVSARALRSFAHFLR